MQIHLQADVEAKADWTNDSSEMKRSGIERVMSTKEQIRMTTLYFWWRCAYGKHPSTSRTRWLRPKRPMILYWRRYGKAGGCQIKIKIFYILIGGVAQLGEHLPCKQGVMSSNLTISIEIAKHSA